MSCTTIGGENRELCYLASHFDFLKDFINSKELTPSFILIIIQTCHLFLYKTLRELLTKPIRQLLRETHPPKIALGRG